MYYNFVAPISSITDKSAIEFEMKDEGSDNMILNFTRYYVAFKIYFKNLAFKIYFLFIYLSLCSY